MKIAELKINGIKNPIGFSYDKIFCSWKVTDTGAKKQKNACIEVADTPDFPILSAERRVRIWHPMRRNFRFR